MSQDDVAVLVCGAMVLGFSVTVMIVCSFIAYRGIREFSARMEIFARRSRFKVLEGGKNKPVDPTHKLGYTDEYERDRKGPKPYPKR